MALKQNFSICPTDILEKIIIYKGLHQQCPKTLPNVLLGSKSSLMWTRSPPSLMVKHLTVMKCHSFQLGFYYQNKYFYYQTFCCLPTCGIRKSHPIFWVIQPLWNAKDISHQSIKCIYFSELRLQESVIQIHSNMYKQRIQV